MESPHFGRPAPTRLIHPREGGYEEVRAGWDLQQHGGEAIPAHEDAKIIGEVLAELD